MTTIDHNNVRLVDVLDCNGETDLEITSEYVELWDAGRETVVGAWVDEAGKIS